MCTYVRTYFLQPRSRIPAANCCAAACAFAWATVTRARAGGAWAIATRAMANSKEPLPVCLRAEKCINDFAEGNGEIVRAPLDQIGALWVNRRGLPVSGKYVHGRWRKIMDEQGFAVSRYRFMILVRCTTSEKRRQLYEHNARFCNNDR